MAIHGFLNASIDAGTVGTVSGDVNRDVRLLQDNRVNAVATAA